MLDISGQVTALAERAQELLAGRARVVMALAGAPAAGKSIMAATLHRRLRDQRVPSEVVQLDGFLLDATVLDGRGLRQRKGAPRR